MKSGHIKRCWVGISAHCCSESQSLMKSGHIKHKTLMDKLNSGASQSLMKSGHIKLCRAIMTWHQNSGVAIPYEVRSYQTVPCGTSRRPEILVAIPYEVRSYQTPSQRVAGAPQPAVAIPYEVRSYQTAFQLSESWKHGKSRNPL